MSGIKSKLERLEQSAGINDPCEVCEAIERSRVRFEELIKRLGIVEPKREPVKMTTNCGWCLRPVEVDLSDFNPNERELYKRMRAVYPAGTLCLPENQPLWDELKAAFDRVARKKYGEHYDEYRAADNIYLDELLKISQRRVPRFHYICRVQGCECNHPKDEADYLRRVKAKGLAA